MMKSSHHIYVTFRKCSWNLNLCVGECFFFFFLTIRYIIVSNKLLMIEYIYHHLVILKVYKYRTYLN